jgi:hypothetical protein
MASNASKPGPDALVLVENEVTHDGDYDFWSDKTGVHYQFPNIYRNRVVPGTPFVYYRGVRRKGGKRGQAEYFGTGIIGDVWQDPAQGPDTPSRSRRWYCAIGSYRPFAEPVSAKQGDEFFEKIGTSLGWRTGVRVLSANAFSEILTAACLSPLTTW